MREHVFDYSILGAIHGDVREGRPVGVPLTGGKPERDRVSHIDVVARRSVWRADGDLWRSGALSKSVPARVANVRRNYWLA